MAKRLQTEFSLVARLNGKTYQKNCADGVSAGETSELARESDAQSQLSVVWGACEAIIRYIGNQKPRSEKFVKPLEKENYRANKDTPYRGPATKLKSADTRNLDKTQPYSRDLKTVECFRCGKKGHMKKDCRVKMEQAKCGVQITKKHLPDWTKNVKINGQSMKVLLDTGCTKSLVHPKCVQKKDYLGYQIPYQTASNKRTYFPAASVTLELEGKKLRIAVGVSEHLAEDMLMGRDIPHFRHYLKRKH